MDQLTEYSRTILKGLPEYTKFYGDPVNMETGNFTYSYQDFSIKGAVPLTFSRFYNAMDKRKGAFGRGWIHNWETQLLIGQNELKLIHTDGREEQFLEKKEGVYQSCQNRESIIHRVEKSYCYQKQENEILLFNEAGKLFRLMNEEYTGINLLYEGEYLKRLAADTGEYLTLQYNEKNQLREVTDHSGRRILYTYQGKKLSGVTDPLGQTMSYRYGANGRIGEILDKRNISVLKNRYDEYRRITSQEFPDGGRMRFRYHDKLKRVCVTEQNGNQITYVRDDRFRNIQTCYQDGSLYYTYDERNNCISCTDKRKNTTFYQYNDQNLVISVTDALSCQTRASYDEEGRLLEIENPDGSRETYRYDGQGRRTEGINSLGQVTRLEYAGRDRKPAAVVFPDGGRLKIEYDRKGNIKALEYPDQTTMAYEYDSLNRVIATRDGLGSRTEYFYDEMDRIIRVIRADGAERTYRYHPMGEAEQITDFDGYCTRWEYNVINKPECYTDKEGRTTRMRYDKMWNLSARIDPEGGETCYSYNSLNRLEQVTDPCGRKVCFTYDPNGNRTDIRYPDGTSRHYEYDERNRKTAETDEQGRVTRFCYDCMGQLVCVTDPAGNETRYEYDAAGSMVREIDVTGAETCYTYTALGKPETITYPGGRMERYYYRPGGQLQRVEKGDGTWEAYTYDSAGNVQTSSRQDGSQTRYVYDCLNQVVQIIRNGVPEKRFTYDAMGHVTSETDGLGNTIRYRYSPEGNLTGVTDPEGNQAVYAYNGRDELTGILQLSKEEMAEYIPEELLPDQELLSAAALNRQNNPLHLTLFQRNGAGEIETVTDALGQQEHYVYDVMGRVSSRTDREGKESRCRYYPGGSLKEALYPDGKCVTLSYDALNNLELVKDWLGETVFARDAAGRITQVTDHRGDRLSYRWNPDGSRKWMAYPNGREVHYEYDEASRLRSICSRDFQIHYRYDANSRLQECRRGNGSASFCHYNERGMLEELVHTGGDAVNGSTVEKFTYQYDTPGNMTGSRREGKEKAYCYESGYRYDRNSRLTEVTRNGAVFRQYRYDGYGNRTGVTEYGVGGAASKEYRYNAINQPVKCREVEYSYYGNGGLKACGTGSRVQYEYQHDSLNRLTAIYEKGELIQKNVYNGLGCRVSRTGRGVEGTVSYYPDYADPYNRILMEKGDRERTYLWQEKELVGMPEEEWYVLTDILHTPVGVLDQRGETRNRYRYDEFGVPEQTREEEALPFGFTGYGKEAVESLYFANAREYNSENGSFLSRDLHSYIRYEDPGTLNLYQYVKGNPLRYVDYSGHECIEEKGYWARAAEQMALGALTDEVTLAGTIGEIGLGFTNLDLPMDIRDITADLTVNFEPAELSWWGMMGLDCLAFLPAIGAFKYTDDAGTLVNRGVKSLKKNLDELGTGAKKAVNSLDHIIRAGKGKTDDIAGYVKTLTNRAEKKLDQVKKVWAGEEVVEGGLGIIEGDVEQKVGIW